MKITKMFCDQSGVWDKDFDIQDSEKNVILVFGNDSDKALELFKKFPKSTMVGCSSSGEIYGDRLREGGLLATFLCFEDVVVSSLSLPFEGYDDSFRVGQKAMSYLNESKNLKGVLVFSEGLTINGAKLAEGMHSSNSQGAVICGGTAGDYFKFEETWVYHQGEKKPNSVVVLGLCGDNVGFNCGSNSGITSLGVEKKITKASKNVLYTMDDKPAFEVYKEWFNGIDTDMNELLLQCPVEISKNFSQEEGLVRTPISFNEEEGSVTFTGEIPEGKYLRMMRANIDKMIEAAERAAQSSWSKVAAHRGEVLNLLISCSGRKALLNTEIEEELFESNRMIQGHSAEQVGFYSYGEITQVNKRTEFVNQTMTVVSLYEK